MGAEVIEAVRRLARRARAAGCPVVFVQHESDPGGPFARQSKGWRIHPDAAPEDGDVVIGKRHTDAFAASRLEDVLGGAGVTKRVVCGFATEGCVDTTVRRARSLGFCVEVAEDTHSTTDGPVLSAEQTVRHHNQVCRIFADVTPSDRIRVSADSPAPVHPDRTAVRSPLVRQEVSASGVIVTTYMPAGEIQSGTFESAAASEKELARRERMARGTR